MILSSSVFLRVVARINGRGFIVFAASLLLRFPFRADFFDRDECNVGSIVIVRFLSCMISLVGGAY